MRMSERDMEILAALRAACDNHERIGHMDGWAKPLDCGGWNGSDHSYRLGKLVKSGYAEVNRKPMNPNARPGKRYRVTPAGQKALESSGST
jgi:hypothetical protein